MKKLILLLLFLVIGSLKVQAQFCGEAKGDQPSSEIKTNFYFDIDDKGVPIKVPIYKWMDRFGNRYADLQIKSKRDETANKSVPGFGFTNPDCQSQGGLFNVFVEDIQNASGTGFDLAANSQMLAVICQVFDDLDVLLNQQASTCAGITKSGVNIRVRSFNDPSSGVLGSASSFYESEGELNGIKHGEVWKAINTGYNEDNIWDGFININLGYSNWYSGFGNTPAGQVDLYTVMLHEVLHSLGFASLINSNGDSKFQGNGVDSYSPYDTFLTSDNGTPLIINNAGYDWDFNPANSISVLTSGCGVSGPNVEFRGDFNAPLSPVHAAASWSGGSSISHFESNCDSYGNTADYVMNPGIATGISRSLTQEEINTLGDLGYQLNSVYGTNTLAGGGTNPRQLSNFTSPSVTSLVATDDYGPCCSTTNYSVEACDGNTLSISVADLLCNDIQSNATVALVEDLSDNTILTISGGNVIYTPSEAGTQVLRYLLEDGNGNQSNYAYIYVDVFPCAGFNCTNTDDCNLICNAGLDDGSSCDNSTSCKRQISGGNASVECGGGLASIDGWYPIVGTPDSVEENCNSSFLNSLPAINGSEYLFLWDGSNFEEGMMTAVQVDPTKNYILSYHRAEGMGNNLNHQLDVSLTNLSDVTWFPNPGQNASGSSIPANQELVIADQFNNANWAQTIQCFSPSQAYDILYFRTSSFGNSLSGIFLDQIELVEDKLQDIQQAYLLGCQETVVIGDALCDITNMEYSWWDVTDSGNPIQLTQGATVVSGNVSVPNGSNGSELEINATQNTTFELRRNFVSSNGITIANNNCNASVQVEVTVDLDVTLTKEVIGDGTAGIGAPVTYQITVTNNTGYPINNLDVTDILAANFNVGTLNVNANANVTASNAGNIVTFTVLNLADGASEQILFDVVVNGTLGETVINCASLEYLDCPLESCVPIELTECITQTPVITADGNDISTDLTYTIPCGETCVTIQATTITNAVYNTTDPVLTDLNGLFCITDDNTLTSFIATVTGLDSCGKEYSQNITVNIEQDCEVPCCDAENNLLDNGDFSQATCGGNGAFNNGCVPNWKDTERTPSINGFGTNPYAWMWSYSNKGEGIAAGFDFKEGVTYSICFRIRTDDKNSGDPNVANNATVNLVATNNSGDITATPSGDYIFNETMGPYLNTWTDISLFYTPDADYSELWVFPYMANPSDGVSQAELSIDDIIISVCCEDEPYIEPYWEFCDSNNVCELDEFPIRVLDDDGTPLLAIDGYTFSWTDSDGNILGTSSALFGAMADTEYTLTVTYPNGCEYTITYIKECCTDEISVSVYDCSKNPQFNKEDTPNSVVKYEDLMEAMEYYNNGSESEEDCDPCDAPTPVVYISILNNGSLITNYQSIVVTWDTNPTGYTITDPTQPLAIYTDVLYTITVTVLDPEGHTCVYTYDYIYECEPDCEVTAPTNLQVSGTTLTWDPVPGATSYIITSPGGNVPQIDCGCDKGTGISIAPVTVNTNSYTLPASLSDKCFVWQVTAICESGEKSPTSRQACYTPKEEKCEVTTPTNLQVSGTTLTWNPVPGAIAYIISSPGGGIKIIDCGCEKGSGVSIAPVTVNTNSYALPSSLKERCFVWQVTAICKNEEKSPISKQACYNGPKKEGKAIISIYPNPNKGDMNIKIDSNNDSNVILNIYKFDGTLVRTITTLKTEKGHLDFNLNLQSRLPSGMYFFIFNIGDNTTSKKVIIE